MNGQEDIFEKVVDLQHDTFSNDVNFVSLTENNNKMCGTAYFYLVFPTSNRAGHGAMDWLQIGKGIGQGCILSPGLLVCRVHHEKCWAG